MGLKCDVNNSSEATSLVESTMESFGRIGILINNAGILLYKNLEDIS
jgi:NAD(P)-dependent dehydrogenase (short-subunit alcohol dehydrogenase family)